MQKTKPAKSQIISEMQKAGCFYLGGHSCKCRLGGLVSCYREFEDNLSEITQTASEAEADKQRLEEALKELKHIKIKE